MKPIATQPQYAAAHAEYLEMGAALGKVNSRLAELEALMRAAAPDPEDAHVEAALEFAKDGVVRVPQTVTVLNEEHAVLRQHREHVTNAMRARATALQTIEGELSATVCKSQAAAHKKLASRMAVALREVQSIVAEEKAFIREIEKAGYSPRFSDYVAWPLLEGTPINSKLRELDSYTSI
jgi:hypothetical protein